MAWCIEHVEPHAFDLDAIALRNAHRYDIGMSCFAHHRDAVGAVAQRTEPGHVIGVQMGIHGFDQFEVEFLHELQVAFDALQHRIDDQCLAAVPAGQEIGVGPGRGVEELAEDHARLRSPILDRMAGASDRFIPRRSSCVSCRRRRRNWRR